MVRGAHANSVRGPLIANYPQQDVVRNRGALRHSIKSVPVHPQQTARRRLRSASGGGHGGHFLARRL